MDVDIFLSKEGLDGLTISQLIIAHIKLGMICARLCDYDYDMRWLEEKRELVNDELNKKMKADNRRKLQKLEARSAALMPTGEMRSNIKEEIAALKKKLEQ